MIIMLFYQTRLISLVNGEATGRWFWKQWTLMFLHEWILANAFIDIGSTEEKVNKARPPKYFALSA
jgi:hypothetical protein